MSSSGRGRGYTGRHHTRPRPGDRSEDDAVRTLAELSPRATDRERHIMEPDREKTCENKERERDNETADLLDNISSEDDAVLKELLRIDEQFQPLLELLEQFSPAEDGIQFNRKLRHFETTISNMCPDENRLQAAFASFRAAALRNPVTARRLAGVGASFTRQQRQQLLRTTLLNVIMQGTFSKLDILERANPLFLINAANLMGDYFSEARLCNGNKVHILASPLLQYMKALLASDDVRAHRSLATQLMQNGRELLAVQQTETEELTIKIRIRLLTPPPCGIVWLLLSSDMALNKFLPLPNCLQQFYASNLKLTADTDYCEVSYGSWKKEETSDESGQSLNLSNSLDDENKPKLRPILGAGAALLRQGQQDVEWTPKSLTKRYDLNSWRQEEKDEPVFDPSVLPPNVTSVPGIPNVTNVPGIPNITNVPGIPNVTSVPGLPNVTNVPGIPNVTNVPRNFEYPPPNYNKDYNNYLQQGDGHYIQNQYYNEEDLAELSLSERNLPNQNTERFDCEIAERATIADFENDRNVEKIDNELQKNAKRPVENWRNSKDEKWTRQKSRDNVSEDGDRRSVAKGPREPRSRVNRRNSGEEAPKSPSRRHVSDVPRNHKYWDHDDRCDKDY